MSRGILLLLALTSTGLLSAEPGEKDRAPVEPKTLPAPEQKVTETQPAAKELDGDRLQVGEVIFNRKTREIRFPAAVNMTDGEILEFAIVHSTGKVHESLLITEVPAIELNVAFKLLRYPESPEFYAEREADGTPSNRFPEVKQETKEGSRIDIGVEWKEGDKTRTAKINEWIAHGTTGESMPADPWVYGGSMIYKGNYLAQATGDTAAIYLSNSALINYSGKDNNSDEVWFPFPKRVPPEGTKVTVIITPHKKTAEKP
ncbi:YdjY domain-containing protein [Haloferula sp. BvORR071]|uniref:YdjY domain-containing protein n=1 Tax=Haloferula sp. BvORR071 TaxID=1396141 RepID=UPI002240FA2C|nr:YdjY domain-containing protein [Haloferula sp. BvORR071]